MMELRAISWVICLLFLHYNVDAANHYRETLAQVAYKIGTNSMWRKEFQRQIESSSHGFYGTPDFSCDVSDKSPSVPTSAHQLRPSDINVVAGIGDSITAGNGIDAGNAIEVLREFRGEAWSMGGDKTLEDRVFTLPNVLKKYNPNLKGFSSGYGGEHSSNAWLNVAVPGAKAADLAAEADMLIERMRGDSRIDWDNDWKLISLLIGANNMCDYCWDRALHSPESVGAAIKAAVDKLHAVVPRALVNLVPMADVTPVPHIKTGWFCRTIHTALCSCALNADTEDEIRPVQLGYYEQMNEMATSGRYDTRDDFTVVVQPFMKDQDFVRTADGSYDSSYIAPDCFHPNRKSHQGISILYWNSMLRPVGKKVTSIPNDELVNLKYICPTKESPYIFTSKNSI